MKVKWYETRKRWRLIVPARFTGTGKKQFILFKLKSDGEAEVRRILNRGSSSKPQISEADEAAFTLAKDEGLSPQQILDAIRLYKQQVLGVTKKATLQETADAFIKYQEHERRNIRTIYSDRQALRDKLIPALGGETPMTEVTLQKIENCIGAFPPGGTRKTLYIRVKKFINWVFREKYIATNLMAVSQRTNGTRIPKRWMWNRSGVFYSSPPDLSQSIPVKRPRSVISVCCRVTFLVGWQGSAIARSFAVTPVIL
jgi:hypothetical protein